MFLVIMKKPLSSEQLMTQHHIKKGSIRGLNYYLEEIIVYNLIYYIEYKI